MTEQEKKEQLELETLKRKSPYALPNNPSAAGWSASQIKAKMYEGIFYLYNLLKELRSSTETKISEATKDKVDKIEGYGLSKNDFTDELLAKLLRLENYDDSNILSKLKAVEEILLSDDLDLDTLQELVNAIKENYFDIKQLYNALTLKANASDVYIKDEIDTKNTEVFSNAKTYADKKIAELIDNAPEALNTLKELALALQAHEDAYDAMLEVIGKKANSSDVPTKVSQLENDKQYLTEHQDISGKANVNDVYTKEQIDTKFNEFKPNTNQTSSFTGTYAEYETASANGLITNGMIVYILDDDEVIDEPDVPAVDDRTSSLLGVGVLGFMILG